MKPIFNLLLPLLIIIGSGLKAQDTKKIKGPKIVFETEIMDYGVIPHNSDGKRDFHFTNMGDEPLLISHVWSSCGCLVARWPKQVIAPGEKGIINAHYATERVGKFEKTLTVECNDPNRPSIALRIKGQVQPPDASKTLKTDEK